MRPLGIESEQASLTVLGSNVSQQLGLVRCDADPNRQLVAHESGARDATSFSIEAFAGDASSGQAHSYACTRVPSTNRSYRLTTGKAGQSAQAAPPS